MVVQLFLNYIMGKRSRLISRLHYHVDLARNNYSPVGFEIFLYASNISTGLRLEVETLLIWKGRTHIFPKVQAGTGYQRALRRYAQKGAESSRKALNFVERANHHVFSIS